MYLWKTNNLSTPVFRVFIEIRGAFIISQICWTFQQIFQQAIAAFFCSAAIIHLAMPKYSHYRRHDCSRSCSVAFSASHQSISGRNPSPPSLPNQRRSSLLLWACRSVIIQDCAWLVSSCTMGCGCYLTALRDGVRRRQHQEIHRCVPSG